MNIKGWTTQAIYDGTGYFTRYYPKLELRFMSVYAFALTPAQIQSEYERWKAQQPSGVYVRGMPVFDVGKYTSVVLDKGGATVKHRCVELHANGTVKDVV